MASVDQLRAQYNAASEANRKAYDELHGGGWNTNYQREYEIAVRDNDKEAKARLEPIVKKLAARYKETQDEKNRLKKELAATENKVAFARQYYNDSVRMLNTAVQQVPGKFFAGMAKVSTREFYEIDDPAARQAPKVQF